VSIFGHPCINHVQKNSHPHHAKIIHFTLSKCMPVRSIEIFSHYMPVSVLKVTCPSRFSYWNFAFLFHSVCHIIRHLNTSSSWPGIEIIKLIQTFQGSCDFICGSRYFAEHPYNIQSSFHLECEKPCFIHIGSTCRI
jgi:hypothetical protein